MVQTERDMTCLGDDCELYTDPGVYDEATPGVAWLTRVTLLAHILLFAFFNGVILWRGKYLTCEQPVEMHLVVGSLLLIFFLWMVEFSTFTNWAKVSRRVYNRCLMTALCPILLGWGIWGLVMGAQDARCGYRAAQFHDGVEDTPGAAPKNSYAPSYFYVDEPDADSGGGGENGYGYGLMAAHMTESIFAIVYGAYPISGMIIIPLVGSCMMLVVMILVPMYTSVRVTALNLCGCLCPNVEYIMWEYAIEDDMYMCGLCGEDEITNNRGDQNEVLCDSDNSMLEPNSGCRPWMGRNMAILGALVGLSVVLPAFLALVGVGKPPKGVECVNSYGILTDCECTAWFPISMVLSIILVTAYWVTAIGGYVFFQCKRMRSWSVLFQFLIMGWMIGSFIVEGQDSVCGLYGGNWHDNDDGSDSCSSCTSSGTSAYAEEYAVMGVGSVLDALGRHLLSGTSSTYSGTGSGTGTVDTESDPAYNHPDYRGFSRKVWLSVNILLIVHVGIQFFLFILIFIVAMVFSVFFAGFSLVYVTITFSLKVLCGCCCQGWNPWVSLQHVTEGILEIFNEDYAEPVDVCCEGNDYWWCVCGSCCPDYCYVVRPGQEDAVEAPAFDPAQPDGAPPPGFVPAANNINEPADEDLLEALAAIAAMEAAEANNNGAVEMLDVESSSDSESGGVVSEPGTRNPRRVRARSVGSVSSLTFTESASESSSQ